MRYLLLFFLLLPLSAQTLTYTGSTPTQASVTVSGTACTFELRENDASGTRLTAIEAAAELVVTRADGVREYLLGKPYGSLALAAARKYYLDCDGANALTFYTASIGISNIAPRHMPFNSAKPNNLDYPTISLATADAEATYTDPVTGLGGVKLLTTTGGFSYQGGPFAFNKRGGPATNWTNPNNLLSVGSTSNFATVAGTTPMDLYPTVGPTNAIDDEPMDTIGIRVWGNTASDAGNDEIVRLCWFRDPDGACISDNVDVSLATGAMALTGTFPSAYPTIWGASSGWGATFKIRREDMPVTGTMTCVAGVCDVVSPWHLSYIPEGVVANALIHLNTSGCTSGGSTDMCKVASVTNATRVVLTTSVTVTNVSFTAFPLGLRITPLTASSKNIGVGWVFAGTEGSVPAAEGMGFCNMNEFTTGDGVKGHLCAVRGKLISNHVYFISNDGSVRRRIAWNRPPYAEINALYANLNDQASQADVNGEVTAFHPTLANAWYAAHDTNGGKRAMWLVTYDGDGTTEATFNYTGSYDSTFPEGTDNVTWTNKTRYTLGKDPESLVTASGKPYNSSLYGNVNSVGGAWYFLWNGVSGDVAFFRRESGQDAGPAWLGAIDLTTETLLDFWFTFDGGTDYSTRWCNGHSFPAVPWPLRTMKLGCNPLPYTTPDSSRILKGPHTVTPNGLKTSLAQCNARGGTHDGTFCTNTSLDYVDTTTYDSACPSDIPQQYKDFGATGSNCITIRFPHQPENENTGATELSAYGQCSGGTAGRTCPTSIRVGDRFVDAGRPAASDSENFFAVKVTGLEVVALRWASWNYTCLVGAGGGKTNCAQTTTQNTHPNGWKASMAPGGINGGSGVGGGSEMYYTFNGDGSVTQVNAVGVFGGHSSLGRYGNNIVFASGTAAVHNQPISSLEYWPVYTGALSVARPLAQQPVWNGVTAGIGVAVQQYLNCGAYAATGSDGNYCLDANAYNNSGAILSQSIGASLGAQTVTAGTGTGVWKITIGAGTLNYKTRPLHGWAGKYMLRDVTPANIASAADYSLCHVYRAGDCGQGSVGETFIKAPRVYNFPWCVPGVSWANVPCVVSMSPTAGGVRQVRISEPSVAGYNSRVLTYAWGGPGMQYPAYATLQHPSGKAFLFQTGMYYDGVRPLALMAPIPPLVEDATPRHKYGVLPPVSVGARTGATHARIKFGYNSSFFCHGADGGGGWNGHARACVTDASSADGFVFEGDTHAATSCGSGCSISVPWTPGRMGRMQVEYCTNSSCSTQVGSPTEVQLVAVP